MHTPYRIKAFDFDSDFKQWNDGLVRLDIVLSNIGFRPRNENHFSVDTSTP